MAFCIKCPRWPLASVFLPESRAETKLACRQSTYHVFPGSSSEVKGSMGQGEGKAITRGIVIIELVTNVGHWGVGLLRRPGKVYPRIVHLRDEVESSDNRLLLSTGQGWPHGALTPYIQNAYEAT